MIEIDKAKYRPRLVDEQIARYLRLAGGVVLEGPRWCGKTWTSLYHAKSSLSLLDKETQRLFEVSPTLLLEGERPHFIDEWQREPSLWDDVRYAIDLSGEKGQFILAGSYAPKEGEFAHGGGGRFIKVRMQTMSLFESGDSSGSVSLKEAMDGRLPTILTGEVDLRHLSYLVRRGGFPGNLGVPSEDCSILPKGYMDLLIENDVRKVDPSIEDLSKVELLAKSLARNEATTAAMSTLERDVKTIFGGSLAHNTALKILEAFRRLYLLTPTPAYSNNVRSRLRLKSSGKLHLADPCLSAALLGLDEQGLINDLDTFGFLFEAMAERDLAIYGQALGAKLFHYQDYSNNEIDALLCFDNGDCYAFEIKLGAKQIDRAASSLLKAKKEIEDAGEVPPKGLFVICGMSNAAYMRKDGVGVIPLTALRP